MEISMRTRMLALVPVLTALFASAAAAPSDAGIFVRQKTNYRQGQVVIADSRFGNGSIRSVVRRGKWGWQVRLPASGSWTDCRRSCEETLRVKTVDFYGDGDSSIDSGGYGSLTRECGIFGCLGGSYELSF
jgi:hypothetical protein